MHIINFPESGNASIRIKNFEVKKRWMHYHLIAELSEPSSFYNYKTKKHKMETFVCIKARFFLGFFKFYTFSVCPVYVNSLEDNMIFDIGQLVKES